MDPPATPSAQSRGPSNLSTLTHRSLSLPHSPLLFPHSSPPPLHRSPQSAPAAASKPSTDACLPPRALPPPPCRPPSQHVARWRGGARAVHLVWSDRQATGGTGQRTQVPRALRAVFAARQGVVASRLACSVAHQQRGRQLDARSALLAPPPHVWFWLLWRYGTRAYAALPLRPSLARGLLYSRALPRARAEERRGLGRRRGGGWGVGPGEPQWGGGFLWWCNFGSIGGMADTCPGLRRTRYVPWTEAHPIRALD